MGDTSISWTDKTWNCIRGCSRVSEGCRNCYAERQAGRFCGVGAPYEGLVNVKTKKWTGEVRFVAEHLADPLRWKNPCRVFVNSMSDLFHEKLASEQIAAVFGVMAAAPQHTFQVLTKRAQRMREWFEWIDEHGDTRALRRCGDAAHEAGAQIYDPLGKNWQGRTPWNDVLCQWPLPNVWLGVSVENQDAADERIPDLVRTPSAVRFLSCEPLLGSVSLTKWLRWGGESGTDSPDHANAVGGGHVQGTQAPGNVAESQAGQDGSPTPVTRPSLSWVIVGCESGPRARPCETAWIRSLRDQCAQADVPLFVKQAVEDSTAVTLGIGSRSKFAGKVLELPYLDGVQHAAFPRCS